MSHLLTQQEQRQKFPNFLSKVTKSTTKRVWHLFAGIGFGDSSTSRSSPRRTYGKEAQSPINDMIDQESAMAAFFTSREDWHPVFRSLAGTDLPKGTASFLIHKEQAASASPSATNSNSDDQLQQKSSGSSSFSSSLPLLSTLEFTETTNPWRRNMNPIPTSADDRDVIAKFLDSMHQSLLEIPVDETMNDRFDDFDDNDMHFVEEGRRMLALNRFVVLRQNQKQLNQATNDSIGKNAQPQTTTTSSTVERYDELFNTCWSELIELKRTDQVHTGSLILLPDYENMSDLRRFTDMNLIRPLEWLGIDSNFEVVSLQRHSPAIRLLYRLNQIPSGQYTENDGFSGVE